MKKCVKLVISKNLYIHVGLTSPSEPLALSNSSFLSWSLSQHNSEWR